MERAMKIIDIVKFMPGSGGSEQRAAYAAALECFGSEHRLKVLHFLVRNPKGSLKRDIAEATGIALPTLSDILNIFREYGVVEFAIQPLASRRGQGYMYELIIDRYNELLDDYFRYLRGE